MGFSFYDYGRPLGLGFSCIVNTGNEADVTAGDLFLHMARDPATDVIILFLEGVRDPARFIEAAQEGGRGRQARRGGQDRPLHRLGPRRHLHTPPT